MDSLYLPIKILQESLILCGGKLYWRKRPESHFSTPKGAKVFNTKYSGNEAGTLLGPKNLYKIIWITYQGSKQQILAHVAVWALTYGYYPPKSVDHRDGNGLNNEPTNLKLANHSQNMHNKRMYRNNKSGYVGVKQHPDGIKWIAFGTHNGQKKTIGSFSNIADAASARKEWEVGKDFSNRHGK